MRDGRPLTFVFGKSLLPVVKTTEVILFALMFLAPSPGRVSRQRDSTQGFASCRENFDLWDR